jgi:predicted nucleic acid-binding protein
MPGTYRGAFGTGGQHHLADGTIRGLSDKIEQRRTERFLTGFYVVKLTEQASDVAINLLRQYRLRYGLAIPDALIAATAIAMNQPLVSKNRRDYRFIKGLQLLAYPLPSAP